MTTITIHGPLQGKGRPRFANGHAYTPEATKRYEGIKLYALDGDSRLEITVREVATDGMA